MSNKCFSKYSSPKDPRNPSKTKYIRTVAKVCDKLQDEDGSDACVATLSYMFSKQESILCVDIIEDIHTETNIEKYNVILFIPDHSIYEDGMTAENFGDIPSLQNCKFELRVLISMNNVDPDNEWDGTIFSRHSGPNHQSWWYHNRKFNHSVQTRGRIIADYTYNDTIVAAYVRIQSKDITYYLNEFMKYIDGQSHVQCRQHRLPMIWSSAQSNKCACTKKERYMCAQLNCDICICHDCFDDFNFEEISYVPTDDVVNTIDNEIGSINSESFNSEESNVESITEYGNDDDNNDDNDDDNDDYDDDDDDVDNDDDVDDNDDYDDVDGDN